MENSTKKFNIWDHEQRKIVCTRLYNTGAYGSCNYGKLTVRKTYTLVRVEVYDCYTYVYLKEFPGEGFNSVYFEEV